MPALVIKPLTGNMQKSNEAIINQESFFDDWFRLILK
jgi:hypothetical protein